MQAALVVQRVTASREKNAATILRMAKDAAVSGARLVLFPEASLTGLINNEDPTHDLPLGEEIPGPFSDQLGAFCYCHAVWLGIGLLEREKSRLYDSAILIDPSGSIVLRYRRIQPQWHGKNADPDTYCQGSEIRVAQASFGSIAFLICGDLFDDIVVSRAKSLHPDYLLFPFARCFSDGTCDQRRWDGKEIPEYIKRLGLVGAPALMTNYITDESLPGDSSFGGAFAVSAQGEVIASLPLGVEGILMVDLKRIAGRKRKVGL